MTGQTREIVWRLRLQAPPRRVFDLLATDEGRASFWVERSVQRGDSVTFHFPDGEVLTSHIGEVESPHRLSFTYFGGSTATFELREAGAGTDLCLRETGVCAGDFEENQAGWVSVLMNLKAQADHRVDLRNHDRQCCWANAYVDN